MQNQKELADQMLEFLNENPPNPDIEMSKDADFLYHFEAARNLLVRECLKSAGINPSAELSVLDFGYLTGITQEFIHRYLPKARFMVFDHPNSPIFKDEAYLKIIRRRTYLQLEPLDVSKAERIPGSYDIIFLGEIIEHLDPSAVANFLNVLRNSAKPDCVLVITTPNATGLYNCWMTMTGKAPVQVAPIPNPVHGYGHIHLWSPAILNQTAEHFGWAPKEVRYYHGREAEMFARAKRKWAGLKATFFLRGIEFLANRKPTLRGFFVATYRVK